MRFFMFSEKSIFDPILVPTWLHFGTQNPPKSTQKSIPRDIKKMIDFWIDLLLKLETQFGTQEPLKTVPERPQDAPKTPPRQPKSHKSTQGRNLVHFWSQSPMGYPPPWPRFSMFLAHFNSIVGAKFAPGNLESFTSKFKIQKVNS